MCEAGVLCHVLLIPIILSENSYHSSLFHITSQVLNTILNIQPKDSGSGGGETREEVVYKQADEMLDKLPPDYVPHEVKHSVANIATKSWNWAIFGPEL